MSAPRRLQLSRKKGARLPAGAVRVARPGRWGNRLRIEHKTQDLFWWVMIDRENGIPFSTESAARCSAVRLFREALTCEAIEQARSQLRGRDLACFCSLTQPCHADVLLEVANG